MKWSTKLLTGFLVVLTIVSISATFYKTVILQDFNVTGVWIEFPTDDSTYVWFYYKNEEYELELKTTDYNLILLSIADAVGEPLSELDVEFIDHLKEAYDTGEVTNTGTVEDTEEIENKEVTEGEVGEPSTEGEDANEAIGTASESDVTATSTKYE
ncbi:MAG TPA: hypothetical protein VGE31_02985 [Candidatus Paceibacterota bacterium]